MPALKDPTGAMPAAAADGSVTLTVSRARAAAAKRAALTIAGLGSAAVLFLWWQSGGALVLTLPLRLEALAVGAVALLALAPLLSLDLLFPPRLTIEARGIISVRRGRVTEIGWGELRGIMLKSVPAGRGGRTQTVTVLSGAGDKRIAVLPIFDVAPSVLAAYINEIHAAVGGEAPLPILRTSSAALQAVKGLRRVRRLLWLVMLVIVGVVATAVIIAIVLLGQLAGTRPP